jgi:hypothetical protein
MNETLDRLLSAYLDGDLSPARRAAVEKRLAEPRVARRLARLRALRQATAQAAPLPSAVQSRRMWLAIQAQIAAQAPAAAEPWYSFLQRRWFSPAWGYGLSAGAAAVAVVLLWPTPVTQKTVVGDAPATPVAEAMTASAPAPLTERPASARAAAPAAPRAPGRREAVLASAPTARPALSEVERALAEDPVEGLIDRFLREQARPLASAPELGLASSARRGLAPGAATTVAAYGGASVVERHFDSQSLQQALGGPDHNGFWDWQAAGAALNKRDWQQARLELEAAQAKAREASERAFAASALTLLSAAGQPLQGLQDALPQGGDLRVLSAGVWQLQMDSRLARFSRGFSARLPGFRVEGDSLLLDMTFDRGSFSAGTRFTRVSGEEPARVLDAAAQPVLLPEFNAPAGADYNVQERELRLR